MRELVRQALREGAVGLSAGLEYEPGRWSTTDEIVELAKELPAVDGIYISHERSEGTDPLWYVPSQDGPVAPTLLDAVQETIDIGERTGARVVASHLKAKGEHYWGSSAAAVNLIQRARDRGVDVWADQYPYPTSGTDGSTVLVPAWATRVEGAGALPPGSRAAVLKRVLGDPPTAKLVRSDIAHEIRRRGGAGNIVVFEYTDKSLYGKSLAEIATAMESRSGRDRDSRFSSKGFPSAPAARACAASPCRKSTWRSIAKQVWVATSTDGGIALPSDGPATHAGSTAASRERFGTTRSSAARFRSSTPFARRHRCRRASCGSAIAVRFAKAWPPTSSCSTSTTIRDKATFFEPHQHSEGVELRVRERCRCGRRGAS